MNTLYSFGVEPPPYVDDFLAKTQSKPRPKPGDEVRVTVVGTVCEKDPLSCVGWAFDGPVHLMKRTVTSVVVTNVAPPTWQVGDVITVKFDDNAWRSYTYVRGRVDWPGDGSRRTDGQINDLYRKGQVKHLLRDGQPIQD